VPEPNKRTLLALLSRRRLLRLAQHFELELDPALSADDLAATLSRKQSALLLDRRDPETGLQLIEHP